MVTKWRPNKGGNNIYAIPDIHGQYEQLQLILSSILPLRKNEGVQDQIIFLGDYVDRGKNAHKVIDYLIELEKKYFLKVIFLRGNHESMFLDAIQLGSVFPSKYDFWYVNGGAQTLTGYLERNNLPINEPHMFSRNRLKDIIPPEHINFLKNNLKLYYETESHIFVHASIDPLTPLSEQDEGVFLWNRSLYDYVKRNILLSREMPWEKTIICGHSTDRSGLPFITDKFCMLDISATSQLVCMEVNSRQIMKAQAGNSRLVRVDSGSKFPAIQP